MPEENRPRWLLALESSTSRGGAALLRDGRVVSEASLTEGLRHGRELMPAAAGLLTAAGLRPGDLWAVAVSVGPGSYTGVRVGVMAAKALAYGIGCRLAAVSSLAALAAGLAPPAAAGGGELAYVVQDARRDEVYAGLYRLEGEDAVPVVSDAALAPEEAAGLLAELRQQGRAPRLAGSGFSTYPDLFAPLGGADALSGAVPPGAVARLGWRHILREEYADPMALQPVYLRRDAGHDWSRDSLIAGA